MMRSHAIRDDQHPLKQTKEDASDGKQGRGVQRIGQNNRTGKKPIANYGR